MFVVFRICLIVWLMWFCIEIGEKNVSFVLSLLIRWL